MVIVLQWSPALQVHLLKQQQGWGGTVDNSAAHQSRNSRSISANVIYIILPDTEVLLSKSCATSMAICLRSTAIASFWSTCTLALGQQQLYSSTGYFEEEVGQNHFMLLRSKRNAGECYMAGIWCKTCEVASMTARLHKYCIIIWHTTAHTACNFQLCCCHTSWSADQPQAVD